jgi:hypothetical protein
MPPIVRPQMSTARLPPAGFSSLFHSWSYRAGELARHRWADLCA